MKANPFGNPDGSRADIEDLLSDFINLKLEPRRIYSDHKTRVIVGAKGSGKTVYLRRMKANIENNDSIYAYTADIAQDLPTTSSIVKFSQFFSEKDLTERWMQLWQCAILRTIASHILCAKELNEYLTKDIEDFLDSYKNLLYPQYKIKSNIYAEVKNILCYYSTKNAIENYFQLREWDELKTYLGQEVLNYFPPMYFFLDCIDEEYGHAPMYWLRSQKGLFYTVMRLLRSYAFGNRLHIIISIRDQVLSSVFRSEHKSRYINDEHIKILKWNYNSISYFLDEKIKNLDNEYFMIPKEKNLENWLGTKFIYNKIRNIEEPLKQYLLRHTRMIPRDIIIVGNALSSIDFSELESKEEYFDRVRMCISKASTSFGNELMVLCANQILNDDMPNSAGRKNYSEVYTSIQEYNDLISSELKIILNMLPSDRFSWNDILIIKNSIKNDKNLNELENVSLDKVFDVLWQNGAIGYINKGPNGNEEIFFIDNEYEDFLLPKGKNEYVLRSCVLDSIGFPIEKVNNTPVLGGRK